jgi:LacI family transcriptional regulator, fructose operon transcriptional repressor
MDKDVKRTTIYDIAQLAGASPSAVSSVLNGTWEKRRISKKLAAKVMSLAEAEGYSVNVQASLLRRDRSNIVGMIVPKYDNRYFGAISEQFEEMARARGLFPIITCTQRDPELEFEAAKEMLSYRVECVISTGATDPDRISAFCAASGVQTINLDLPGTLAPSVISDNYAGAHSLTCHILDRCARDLGAETALYFIGGRLSDHNTAARLQGFMDAHQSRGLTVPKTQILASGYSAEKAFRALETLAPDGPAGLFVNSTIALEGVVRWYTDLAPHLAQNLRYGCFDWDPFGSFLPGNVGMVEQDVSAMLEQAFALIGTSEGPKLPILVPCRLRPIG